MRYGLRAKATPPQPSPWQGRELVVWGHPIHSLLARPLEGVAGAAGALFE